MHPQQTRYLWTLLALSIGLAMISAPKAEAQSRQGSIFNSEIFNVGGPGMRGGEDGPDTQGSVGCGLGWGGDLSDILNRELNQSGVFDSGLRLGQRRDLWRFCDAMTDAGSGWDTLRFITIDEEAQQNTGFAPAEMFGQVDVAQSIASSQVTAIAARVQKVRIAMRSAEGDERFAFVPRQRENFYRAFTLNIPTSLMAPMNFAQEDEQRTSNANATISKSLDQGMNGGDNALGIEGLGMFLTGRYVRLDADTSSRELGSETDGGGLTLGVDYRIGSNFVLGAGFGYNHYATDFSRDAGSSDVDDYAGLLFGSYFFEDKFFIDATLRGSHLKTDNEKQTPTMDGGPDLAKLKSDPDGWTISGDIGVGTEYARGALLLNPYLRFGVYHTEIEGFSETGGDGSMNLKIERQEVTSLPLTLGGSAVYYISTPMGVVAPYLRVQYMHEFNDQATTVKGFLKVIPDAKFKLKPNSTDRDYGTIGTGASMNLKLGWSGFVDYDALVGFSNLESHTLTVGLRKQL
ncbi:MAG: autotransporter outer membrane beta-barrel domain-containing protein [Deltaproteobacteria bacterium]|nr:autotransporter outer membrane beta-barrel domain-containing protein [Deltaproteobacteria bacterium]